MTEDRLKARAVNAADRRRHPPTELGWREALAEAPWVDGLPQEHERSFRRAYAARLVERGVARAAGVRASDARRSGEHKSPRWRIRESRPGQFAEWDAIAARTGLDRAEWVWRTLDAAK